MLIERTRVLAAAASLAVMADALAVAGAAHAANSSALPSARNFVTDTYEGVQVSDQSPRLQIQLIPKVRDWSVAEVKCARQYCGALRQRGRIYGQLQAQNSVVEFVARPVCGRRKLFALHDEPRNSSR